MGQALARGPGAHELAHQPPLRAAGVLELVHQDVLVARLQPVAAARELLHLRQQPQRALEQVGKVERALLVERAPVLVLRHREQPPDAAGQHQVDVGAELLPRGLHVRPQAKDAGLVAVEVGCRPELRPGVGQALARLSRLGEHVIGQTVESAPHARRRERLAAHQIVEVAHEQREARRVGPAGHERRHAAGHRVERGAQGGHEAIARFVHVHLPPAQEAVERVPGHHAPIEQGRQALAQPALAQFGEHQTHVGIVQREAAADAQRAIERPLHQARRLGFVGQVEARVDAGLEGELVEQCQAEGVDGEDADVGQRLAHGAPALARQGALLVPLAERGHHALAHLGRGLAGEGDGQDVPGRHAHFEQADVAVHQHARLARARRGLEGHVAARVDGQPPRPLVGRLARLIEVEAGLLTHRALPSSLPLPSSFPLPARSPCPCTPS